MDKNLYKVKQNLTPLRGRKPILKLTLRQRKNLWLQKRHNNTSSIHMRPTSPAAQAACNHGINFEALSSESHQDSAMSVVSEPCSEQSSIITAVSDIHSVSSVQLDSISSVNTSDKDPAHTFRESLASAFIKGNLTHAQGNIILKTLRSLSYLAYFPQDTRTLLNTPRVAPQVRRIYPGEYLHIGFEKVLIRILQKTPSHLIPDLLNIDLNTDGARLNKSGNLQIWPIQCMIANIPGSKPEVAGVYKGPKKPYSIDLFLDEFIKDILLVIERGGIFFRDKQIPIALRAFIADAPARSWILNHFGHTSSHPCSKCKVVGIHSDGQLVFTGIEHRIRTDDEYARCVDDDHHKGPSPLSRLPIGLVSQVSVEYMHLICIGIVKKLLSAWITGKYGKK